MVSVNITLPKSTTVPREDGKLCFLFLPTKSQKINLSMLYIYCSEEKGSPRQSPAACIDSISSSKEYYMLQFQKYFYVVTVSYIL